MRGVEVKRANKQKGSLEIGSLPTACCAVKEGGEEVTLLPYPYDSRGSEELLCPSLHSATEFEPFHPTAKCFLREEIRRDVDPITQ